MSGAARVGIAALPLHRWTQSRCLRHLLCAALIVCFAPPAWTVEPVAAVRIKASVEPLGMDADVRNESASSRGEVTAEAPTSEATEAIQIMLQQLRQQARYQDDWLFSDAHSIHRVTGPMGIAGGITVVPQATAGRYIVIAPAAREHAEVDAAGLFDALSGQPQVDDRYVIDSIAVEHAPGQTALLGLSAKKSRFVVTQTATEAVFGLRLTRTVDVSVWHTAALPAARGREVTALLAGADSHDTLRETLQREDIGFPLQIETRVRAWSGDGTRPDPGSFRWRVTEAPTRETAAEDVFSPQRSSKKVERLSRLMAPEKMQDANAQMLVPPAEPAGKPRPDPTP